MTRRSLLTALLLAACRRKRRAPEDLVRDAILTLEEAVEAKDLGPLKAALSEGFKGGEETDRRAAIGLLQMTFMRHPSIYLLVRIKGIEVIAPGQVRADLLVAMASVPLRDVHELPRVQADLYEFVLTFAEEERDTFRVAAATWAPARLEGFL
jgi:hypothetical protein